MNSLLLPLLFASLSLSSPLFKDTFRGTHFRANYSQPVYQSTFLYSNLFRPSELLLAFPSSRRPRQQQLPYRASCDLWRQVLVRVYLLGPRDGPVPVSVLEEPHVDTEH